MARTNRYRMSAFPGLAPVVRDREVGVVSCSQPFLLGAAWKWGRWRRCARLISNEVNSCLDPIRIQSNATCILSFPALVKMLK